MNKLFTKIAGLSLGLAMAIGVGVGLGERKASEARATENTYTFTSKSWADSTSSWTSGKEGNAYTANQGVQITNGVSGANCTSKQSFTNVSNIVVSYCTNASKGKGSIKVQIGTGTEKTYAVSAPSSGGTTLKTTSFDYSPVESGSIKLTVECGTNSIYINSIYVKYNVGSNYNISFNANGGSGNMTTVSTTSPYEAPECGFTAPANKAFAYWTVGAAGTGTHYAVGDEITFTSNIELYANWSDAYTVSFNSNGGSGLMNPVTVGNSYKAPECEFTAPANKQFAYWTVGAAGTGTHYAVGEQITLTSSTTLFANWEDKPLEAEISSFTSVSGNLGNGAINYTSAKGNGTTAPVINSNKIRLYKPSSGYNTGGTLTISSEEYKINKIILKSNRQSGFKYSVDGGTQTSISGTGSSPFTFTLDELDASSVTFLNVYTDNNDISYLFVSYRVKEAIVPTKAVVALNNGKGSYYNGSSTKNCIFKTSDIIVTTINDAGKTANVYATGTGFKVTINGNELNAVDNVQELSFTGMTPGQFDIRVVVPGVGLDGANVTNESQTPAVKVTIIAKQPTENAFKFESLPAQSYVSHLDEFAIKGTLVCGYTDGTSGISNELMRLDLFEGTTASGNAVYSLVDTEETKDVNRIYNVLKSEDGLIVNSGLDFCDDSFVLKYNSVTQFTYRITLLKYSSNNYFDTTVTVYPITLTAEDNSEQTYYKGGTYEMSATVTAHWNNNAGSKVLDSSLYEINGGEAFEPTEEKDDVEISVSLVNDSAKTTTYTVDVIAPSTPKHLEILLADDYKAGNNFHLGADAEVTFEGMATPQPVPYDSSELSYSLVATYTSEFDDGIEITPKSPMFLSYVGKYIIARYTMGDNYVDSDAELIEKVASATIENYTPAGDPTWTKVTDASSLAAGDTIVIAYSYLDNNEPEGFVAGDITSQYLSSLDADFSNNLSEITSLPDDAIKFVLGGTTGSWTLANSKDSTKLLGATAAKKVAWNDGTTTWSISITDGKATIQNGTESYGRFLYNSSSPRFTTYTSATSASMLLPQIYKKNQTPAVGNVVTYLKSFIDANRLNNELSFGLSICHIDTSSPDWAKAKTAFKGLTQDNILELSVQDRFGEVGKTYVDTYNKLISLDPTETTNPLNALAGIMGSSNNSIVVILISLMGIATIGGFFYYKKRKEN